MLNKIQLLSLNDYIDDPNSMNLKLFAMSVNPSASFKPKELIALIDKYKVSKDKNRLVILENYLGAVKTKKTKVDKSYLPKSVAKPEDVEKLAELATIKKKYIANMSRQGSKTAAEENEVLRAKIDDMEQSMGIRYDYKDLPPESAEDSEKSLLLGILGDWNDTSSISWELLNGQKTYFEVVDNGRQSTVAFGMAKLLQSLAKFSGKPVRPFNINFVFPQGDSSGKAKWVFSMQPIMSSTAMMTNTLNAYNSELGALPQ